LLHALEPLNSRIPEPWLKQLTHQPDEQKKFGVGQCQEVERYQEDLGPEKNRRAAYYMNNTPPFGVSILKQDFPGRYEFAVSIRSCKN
jgi:hypothetical protein